MNVSRCPSIRSLGSFPLFSPLLGMICIHQGAVLLISMKILLVDDDEQVTKLVKTALTSHNYIVDVAADGLEGWEYVEASFYDLILLDVMLPRLDGISFCRRLRAQKLQTPIILLTARNSSFDKVTGLEAGADDYLVKPFDVQELLARIRALLRRESYEHAAILEWGVLRLNPATLQVTYREQPLRLRKKEFAILELLLRNRQRVFSRSAILEQLWSLQEAPSEETIKAHIKAIRHQLRKVGAEDLIETLYGQGYRLNPAYLNVRSPQPPLLQTQAMQVRATQSALAEIWQQTKSVSFDRVAVLEAAAQALSARQLTDDLRQNAERSAHKLLGVLGTFGFTEAAQLARQLEEKFGAETVLQPEDTQQMQRLVAVLRQCIEQDNQIQNTSVPIATAPAFSPTRLSPQLLIIDSNRRLVEELAAEATAHDIRTLIATTVATAREQVRLHHPDAILLDLSLETGEDGLRLLEELAAYRSQIPILVLTARDQFSDRLAVARLGGRAFLPKSTPATTVIQVISQVLQQVNRPKTRILAIDDDAQVLLILQTLLQPSGLEVIPVTDPAQFWQTLQSTAPDLVILDVEMLETNGVELCQVIRSDPRWSWLPVLFLTAHTNAEIRNRVFEVGADDYLTKPIATTELVQRILNRLNRTQLVRSQVLIS